MRYLVAHFQRSRCDTYDYEVKSVAVNGVKIFPRVDAALHGFTVVRETHITVVGNARCGDVDIVKHARVSIAHDLNDDIPLAVSHGFSDNVLEVGIHEFSCSEHDVSVPQL